MLIGLVAVGCAPEPSRWVHLDFSDGSHGVTFADDDDATRLASRLCEAEAFAPFEPAAACGGGDRGRCADEVLAAVEAKFAAYDVGFTTTRPERGPYDAVVVAPALAACSFGRRGVAFADCGDDNPANLGFAFDCHGDAASCAALVAHEVAHGFGLVHVLDGSDLMTFAPEDPTLGFRDEALPAADNTCGVTAQNAHRTLLARLGASGGRQVESSPRRW